MDIEVNRCLQETDIPERMTKAKMTLIKNKFKKGSNAEN